ncbi:isoamyl acetate-hydrolyzing esterase 1 homolog isoform X2 [Chiloscyllium punctatum]|uniref:isoamyl acetate-hydrolyzing esterase 1 homolog isoform X2 n=1 Tax=Chiloscyllium punctatum TaxID=137246 RepID=UPI003B6332CF
MWARGSLWPKVILFGDSITQRMVMKTIPRKTTKVIKLWFHWKQCHRLRKCDVLNRGLSGYNTKWALSVLPKIITQPANQETIAAVIVMFGANDSALKDINPVQHIPLTEYAENLKGVVQYLKSIDICEDKVIMVTPPPLDESAWEKECIAKGSKLNRYNSVTNQYAAACVKVAEECGIDVLDLCTLMQMKNQETRAPGGNPRRHGENVQTPHRQSPEARIEPGISRPALLQMRFLPMPCRTKA